MENLASSNWISNTRKTRLSYWLGQLTHFWEHGGNISGFEEQLVSLAGLMLWVYVGAADMFASIPWFQGFNVPGWWWHVAATIDDGEQLKVTQWALAILATHGWVDVQFVGLRSENPRHGHVIWTSMTNCNDPGPFLVFADVICSLVDAFGSFCFFKDTQGHKDPGFQAMKGDPCY